MSKIAVVADSGCQISLYSNLNGIYIVPLQVMIEQDTYLDGQPEDMKENPSVIDSKTTFERMDKENVIPKTSQPTTGALVETFTKIKEDGYDEVIAISIATGLSSTLNGMKLAVDMIGIPVTLIDSKGTARNHRYLVEIADRLVKEGKTSQEIKVVLEELVENSATLIYASNLDHLRKGGRITPAVAMLGNMLKIVPVMKLNYSLGGKIDSLTKVRTIRKANVTIINHLVACGVNQDEYIVTIEHVDDEATANEMIALVKEKFGPNLETVVGYLPSVVGVHMGIGGMGYQYIKKYKAK